MGAAVIAARGEGRLHLCDLGQRRNDIARPGHARRIGGRSDDDKIVVHDVKTFHPVTFGDESLFGGLGVHKKDIAIAVHRILDRLSGADGDDSHLDVGLVLKKWQDLLEKAGILGRCGGLHHDELVLCRSRAGQGKSKQRACRQREDMPSEH